MSSIPIAQVVTSTSMFESENIIYAEEVNVNTAHHNIETHENNNKQDFLLNYGLSLGLSNVLLNSNKNCMKRYWIIDNSGSMTRLDGSILNTKTNYSCSFFKSCSRWEELCQTLKWHGEIAINLNSEIEYHLINKPSINQSFSFSTLFNRTSNQENSYNIEQKTIFGKKKNNINNDINKLNKLLTIQPNGSTPICLTISNIIKDINKNKIDLIKNHQKISITIATDGISTDGDLALALKPLIPYNHLVSIVIRLCTNDPFVIRYWNNIDNDLEIELDVLDDFYNESKEVNKYNPWLTYTKELHHLREWGNLPLIFDMIDERELSLIEKHQMISLILGKELTQDLPDIQVILSIFYTSIDSILFTL